MTKIIRNTQTRRIIRVRKKIKETGRGRKLTVFRSNRYISAQVIDIVNGRTLLGVAGQNLGKKIAGKNKSEVAFLVGEEVAKKAVKLGIKKVTFDRGPYKYHGRIKALADGARKGGLIF